MITDKYYKISKKYPLEIKLKQKIPKFVHQGFWYRNLFGQWVLSFSNIVHKQHHQRGYAMLSLKNGELKTIIF